MALVSFGSQPLPSTASAICNEEQEFIFTWSTDLTYAYNDYAMVVVYDSEHKEIYYHPAIAARGTGTATAKLPQFKGKEVDVYLAFTSDDRKQRTNSMYLGKLAIS